MIHTHYTYHLLHWFMLGWPGSKQQNYQLYKHADLSTRCVLFWIRLNIIHTGAAVLSTAEPLHQISSANNEQSWIDINTNPLRYPLYYTFWKLAISMSLPGFILQNVGIKSYISNCNVKVSILDISLTKKQDIAGQINKANFRCSLG